MSKRTKIVLFVIALVSLYNSFYIHSNETLVIRTAHFLASFVIILLLNIGINYIVDKLTENEEENNNN